MKRIRSLVAMITVLVMVLTTVPVNAAAAWLGDVKTDEKVNMRDCMLLYQAISNGSIPEGDFSVLGDVDQNSTLNMRDCMRLFRAVSRGEALPEVVLESELPAEDPNALTAVDPATYYGRSLLAAENAVYVEVYDYLDEQINALNTDIILYRYHITLSEFERIMWHYRDDHPEVFWLNRTYSYSYYSQKGANYIYSLNQNYLYTEGEIRAYQTQLENCAQTYLEGITNAMPEAERSRIIHDRIILNASYDTTYCAPHTREAIGVLVYGTGVCESYARAYQYLMYRCGIRVTLVTGVTHSGESHMWNAVEIDGEWYQTDVTWDDPVFSLPMPDYLTYSYFNITTKQMLLDRDIDLVYSNFKDDYLVSYPVPECTATAANYYVQNAVKLSEFDIDIVGKAIAQSVQNGSVATFCPVDGYTLTAFAKDFSDSYNFWDLIDVANTYLSEEQQLETPGYVKKVLENYGAFEVYLRNM